MQTLQVDNLKVTLIGGSSAIICYMLYPYDEVIGWAEAAAKNYDVSIAVITNIDWDNALTPWPAAGVPTGSPDFEGLAPQFLDLIRDKVIPQVEIALGIAAGAQRTLVGVSLSGLFTLWQWLECDLFDNIISLSGSFWYEYFVVWVKSRKVSAKRGRAYFLLGIKEALSPVLQFKPVQTDTVEIVDFLKTHGVDCEFELVPGNHYQFADQRLTRAFTWMFG